MKKGIKEIWKKLSASILVAILMLTSCSQVMVYAYNIGIGNSGATTENVSSGDTTYTIYGSFNRVTDGNYPEMGNVIFFNGHKIFDYYVKGNETSDYYCLRGNANVQTYAQAYSNKISIMDDAETVISNIKNAGMESYISFKDGENSVRSLQWLVKNMYYVSADTSEDSKSYMIDNLNTIISEFGGKDYNKQKITDLDEEFIGVIQQFAVWQFVNHNVSGDSIYSNGLTKDNISKFTINNSKDIIADTENKVNQAYALYISLVNGAKAYAEDENYYSIRDTKNKDKITVSGTGVESLGYNTYKIGPITIDNNIKIENESNVEYIEKVTDTIRIDDTEIETNKKYYSKNGNEITIEGGNIKDLIGQEFYVEFTTDETIDEGTIKYKATAQLEPYLSNCEGYIYITGPNALLGDKQPILGITKSIGVSSSEDNVEVTKLKDTPIDLALTKQITAVEREVKSNDTTTTESIYGELKRLINIDNSILEKKSTARYYMNKTAITVAPGDIVTYKITVYNEGDENANVKQITDYLPEGLEPIEGEDYTYIASNNSVVINFTTDNGILLYGIDSGKENTYEVNVKFRVSEDAEGGNILRNVAEITNYGYMVGDEYKDASAKDVDRDSQQNNVKPNSYENAIKKYTDRGNDLDNMDKGSISQQDDDDFEQVVVGKFDLALRKFISNIRTSDDNTQEEITIENREPKITSASVIDLARDGTAIYYHSKEPISVKKGDIVTYTIRIYNEGYIDGYAKEITDYLPNGLEFIEDSELNKKNGWNATQNGDGTTTVTTNYLQNTLINASNGVYGYQMIMIGLGADFYEDVSIECKVGDTNSINSQILTNVAEITSYGYYKGETFVEANKDGVDRDSQEDNVFTSDVKNISDYYTYQNVEETKNQYEGIQDDDDFENIKVEPFDLALRKFISQVNGVDLEESREPIITGISAFILQRDGTAGYFHKKTPITLKTGDRVIYTIRVYNEGYIDGYAKEITDYLPNGLEFVEDSELNKENGWEATQNGDGTTKVTTTILADTQIPASHGARGYLEFNAANKESKDESEGPVVKFFWTEVKIECEITSVENDKVLTNVAEITKYGYNDESGTFIEANQGEVDEDSEENNVYKEIDNLTDTSGYYDYQDVYNVNNNIAIQTREGTVSTQRIIGIQDDDDFENVKVEAKLSYDLVLRKTDENGKEINGAYFTITSGEETLLNNEEIQGNKTINQKDKLVNTDYIYTITENESAEGYVNILGSYKVQVATYLDENTRLNLGTCQTESHEYYEKYGFVLLDEQNNIVNDTDTDLYTKVSVSVNNSLDTPQITVTVQNGQFDLALRKFITGIRTGVGSKEETRQEVTDRVPVFKVDENGNYVYEHTKEPVLLGNQNIVEYTIRVYNEGSINGYATEIKDDIPEGLEFLPDDELNKEYGWILLDEEGNVVEDVNEAKYITTDYLSKEKEETEGENLLKGFDITSFNEGTITEPEWKEVKVAFKVTIPNTDDRIIINQAQISDDSDENGNEITDKDSTPDEWNEGEDDQDIEKVEVQYFDLALRKWVTKAIVIEDGKETVAETGHTAEDDPEEVVKVDLKKSKLEKVVVKFEYQIRVTNEGEIAGYAKEISDYIPEGLRFEAADNPLWQEAEGKVTTDQLKDTLLKPGESAEATIILTWINREDNMGLKTNVAEISKDENEYDSPDIDSTPDNQVPEEDDIDDAPVMLTVKTGQAIVYIGTTSAVLAILGIGIALIKKFVLV